jgi:hypothetical protein
MWSFLLSKVMWGPRLRVAHIRLAFYRGSLLLIEKGFWLLEGAFGAKYYWVLRVEL